MAFDCGGCGLTNLPYAQTCANCGFTLLDAAEAAAKRSAWDAFPEATRLEFDAGYAKARERWNEHLAWLRRHRILHAAIGGFAAMVCLNAPFGFPSLWLLPIDLAAGACAGLWLNGTRGGAYRGLGAFAAAAIVGTGCMFPFIDVEAYWRGWWLMTGLALFALGGLGYMMGHKLALEHVEHFYHA
jgi:hypothetical protein